jgi:hypothetical protein
VAPGFFPLDHELALLPGALTPRVQESLVRLSTWIPSFAKAAAELAWFTQVEVGRETARRLTEAAGATAVALDTARAAHILQHHPAPPPGPDQLVFSVDGAMIPLVGGQWTEARTLAVGAVVQDRSDPAAPTSRTTALSYFSRRTDSETFIDQAVVELHRRGIETAPQVAAVVDGAAWCQQFIDVHAPQAVRILDLPHAAGYISAIGETVGPRGRLLTPTEQTRLIHDLKHDGPADVIAALQPLVTAHPELVDLPTQVAYLTKRTDQLQYPQFAADGWPLGSGMVESANKLVVEDRLKGAGMHWADQNVNPLLALRNAVCNDRWDEVWMQIEAVQRRQVRVRRRAQQRARRAAHHPAPAPTPPPAAPVRPVAVPGIPPAPEERRPASTHPWRTPWSIRQQRKLADERDAART